MSRRQFVPVIDRLQHSLPSIGDEQILPAPAASWIRIGHAAMTAVLLVVALVQALAHTQVWVIPAMLGLLFAGLYAIGLIYTNRLNRVSFAWWLVCLAICWLALVIVSQEFLWLAFSLWLLAGFGLRLPWAAAYSGVLLVVLIVLPAVTTGTTTYSNIVGPFIGCVFALGTSWGYSQLVRDAIERRRLVVSLIQTQNEMSALQDELARTQRESGAIAERTRISRDIHDTVAQGISSIAMLSRAALDHAQSDRTQSGQIEFDQVDSGHAESDHFAAQQTGQATNTSQQQAVSQQTYALIRINEIARESLADARRIVAALMPAELETGALADALTRMLTRLHDQTGIDAELYVEETFPALPTTVEVALLRTAQSALANVQAHSGAARVVVTLVDAADMVRLDVVDDGRGFDVSNVIAGGGAESGYGLRSMRERLHELGGGLELESSPPGGGTALSAYIPLARSERG